MVQFSFKYVWHQKCEMGLTPIIIFNHNSHISISCNVRQWKAFILKPQRELLGWTKERVIAVTVVWKAFCWVTEWLEERYHVTWKHVIWLCVCLLFGLRSFWVTVCSFVADTIKATFILDKKSFKVNFVLVLCRSQRGISTKFIPFHDEFRVVCLNKQLEWSGAYWFLSRDCATSDFLYRQPRCLHLPIKLQYGQILQEKQQQDCSQGQTTHFTPTLMLPVYNICES